MRDRLSQLQAAAERYAEEQADASGAALGVEVPGGIDNEVRINIDEEIGPAAGETQVAAQGEVAISTPQETYMVDFFDQVKEIRAMIDAISSRVEELKRRQFEVLSAPQVDEETKQDIDQIMLEIKQDANKIRTKLKVIEKNLSDEEESKRASADFRIRKTQYNTMYRLLCDVLSDYNTAQTQFREKCKETIKRQLGYTGKTTTDEEVEEMIETGNTQAFIRGILMDEQQARQMLRDVTSRHEDIKKLENSIKELYDMFMEFAMLVETQGEMIDRIEFNVSQTADYVEEAIEETMEALHMKRATRKKKCICCVALIIGIVIAIVILISVLCGTGICTPQSGNDPKTPATVIPITTVASSFNNSVNSFQHLIMLFAHPHNE